MSDTPPLGITPVITATAVVTDADGNPVDNTNEENQS